MRAFRAALALTCVAAQAVAAPAGPKPPALTAEAVDAATYAPLPEPPAKTPSAEVMRAEIMLDRARFSPGAIDGVDGDNFRKAVAAYQTANGLQGGGKLDQATWDKLAADTAVPLSRVTITAKDLAGPFTRHIPTRFEAQSRLERLGYRNLREELAERFHLSQAALRALNPRVGFRKPGETIAVPNLAVDYGTVKATRVVVDKKDRDVEAFGPDDKLIAFYPASIGSTEKPAPTGDYVIQRIAHNPDYTYDPAYKFKGVKAKHPFTIAPGPNNPVGAVWMDLSYDGYGIHGTPDPEAIGKTQSHGCIRLTNWDALDLALLVDKGVPVSFRDGP